MNVDTARSHDDVRLDIGHGNELLQSDDGLPVAICKLSGPRLRMTVTLRWKVQWHLECWEGRRGRPA
jgi:hypothetical protein